MTMRILITMLCLVFAASHVSAAKPEWAGQGKGGEKHADKQSEKHQKKESKRAGKSDKHGLPKPASFSSHEHELIRAYFGHHGIDAHGNGGSHKDLPPGLRKKLARGGELPPGWQRKLTPGSEVDEHLLLEAQPLPDVLDAQLPYDAVTEEIIRIQDKVIRMSRGDGTIIDVIDIADVLVGGGMRSE